MLPYFTYPYGRPESLEGEWLIATYRVERGGYDSVLRRSGNFAVGQTIGTWVKVPGITGEMVERRQGRVLQLVEFPPAIEGEEPRFLLRLAFPTEHFGGSMTMLMTALVGNDVSTALPVSLVDLEFANGAERAFAGPRFGFDRLRELAGVAERRPLLLNMIKPCAGFSPEQGGKFFYEVAKGGVDLIKDDELLGSPRYNDVVARTRAYLEASRAAAEQTGKTTLYIPNVSGNVSQIKETVGTLIGLGVKACLFNFVFGGLDVLKEIADCFGDQIFLLAHYAGAGVLNNPASGIANPVFLGLLPRLAGADASITMMPDASNGAQMYDFYRTVQAQTLPLGSVRPTAPAVGGGMTPLNQIEVHRGVGPDLILAMGGAIQGHPMGATQGALAAMAAVKAVAKDIPLTEAAADCEPLALLLQNAGA